MSSPGDLLLRVVTRRAPSGPVAVGRVLFGVAALLKVLEIQDKMFHVATEGALTIGYAAWLPTPTRGLVIAILAAWIVGAVGFTLGLLTRASAIAMTVGIAATFLLDQQMYANHFYLMLIVAILFTLTDAGAAWSVDAWRRGRRADVPAWPVDLLKIQLTIVYGFAAITKMNATYLRGDVLDAYLVHLGPWDFPDAWQIASVLIGLSIASVAIEAYLAVGFWLGRWPRLAAVVIGIGFHAAIVATMRSRLALVVFSLVMLSMYPLFFSRNGGQSADSGVDTTLLT